MFDGTDMSTNINTIPAQEIKRRGISAVDELLSAGPVFVIKNNRPQYVVVDCQRYQELMELVKRRTEELQPKVMGKPKKGKKSKRKSVNLSSGL